MAKTILTKNQGLVLDAIANEPMLAGSFYLTGGTALSEFYLRHRLSEDLDFFSEAEVDSRGIFSVLKKIQKNVPIKKIDYEQSFNRNLFFLHLDKEVVKTEFTYFPFPQIEKPKRARGICVDSLRDIAVNKIFTIYQKPRSRDFIDLYFIVKQKKWTLDSLMKKARIKFDWHIDPLQMGAQFLQAEKVKDYPRMIIKVDHKDWQEFFVREAKKLGREIVK